MLGAVFIRLFLFGPPWPVSVIQSLFVYGLQPPLFISYAKRFIPLFKPLVM